MKQLHNIMAPLILFCLMMVSGLPGFAQEQGEATSGAGCDYSERGTGEYGGRERNRIRTYRRLLRMAYYHVG